MTLSDRQNPLEIKTDLKIISFSFFNKKKYLFYLIKSLEQIKQTQIRTVFDWIQ